MRAPQEMLYEVITNTIYLDNAINEIISLYFHNFDEQENEDKTLSFKPLEMFHRLFLQDMGSHSKLKIVKEIGESCIKNFQFPKGYEEKFRRFYIIRNIFAHSLYPKHVEGKELPHKFPSDAKWEDLYKEHKEAFDGLNDFLIKTVYNKVFEFCIIA